MSDDDRFLEDDVAVAETPQAGKKVGIIPALLIKILKWAALGIGAIIFIVTVVVATMSILNSGTPKTDYLTVSEAYQGKPPLLEYFSNIGQIRGRTTDEATYTVIVEPIIGYDPNDKALQTELIARTPQFQDLIRSYFSSKTAEELKPVNDTRIKLELKEMINRILSQGKIKELIFKEFNVIGM